MTPSFDQINQDDQLLDALGARGTVRGDELTGLLSAWTTEIDNPTALPRPGRHARHSRALRIGLTTTVVLGTLSVGGVAAAVTGTKLPVLHQLGQVTQSFWGEQAAPSVAGPPSASAPPQSTDASTPWSIDPTPDSGTSRDQATRDLSTHVPSLVPPSTRTHLPGAPVVVAKPKGAAPSSSSTSTPAPTTKSPSPTKSSGTPTPTGTSTSAGTPTRSTGPVFGTASPPAPSSSTSSDSEPTATPKLTPSSSTTSTPPATSSATSSSSATSLFSTPTSSNGAQKSR
ncbi:hypothetical protein [Branchiibius sp. NY16-3462-2]|uniref:hypothetical protein n=1 Tax=Branchiibius sp. NY16-3462-2 TaxID=1807500 RepID=UPI0007982D54|nr:hypothetical protein [Branchiibius sp. NY16-3462-2]KYH45297.1 hypothetical protein AZH51_05325 [Branchiibius sp. NY16-3462-2]